MNAETGKAKTVGTTELAAILGISRQRVNELGRIGKIVRESDGQWDVAKVRSALGANLDHRQSTVTRTGNREPEQPEVKKIPPAAFGDAVPLQRGTIAYETYRLTKEKADRAELERLEAEGRLIDATSVEAKFADFGTRVKDEIMAMPTRIVNQLPDEWRREVYRVASQEARRALTAISNEFMPGRKTA